jgi:hypothetical protein
VGEGCHLGEPEHLAAGEPPAFESPPTTTARVGDQVVAPGEDPEGGGELFGVAPHSPACLAAVTGGEQPVADDDLEGGKVARLGHRVANVGRAYRVGRA